VSSVDSTDAGTYIVTVSGACGTDISDAIMVSVREAVTITTQPDSIETCGGEDIIFEVVAVV